MRLSLNNVRNHKDLSLDIPNTGIVMLQGPSGSGKSTIFDAICEALYQGEESDIVPWGESKSRIELDIGDLSIVVTRGPKSLTVKKGEDSYSGEAAAGVILSFMGMESDEFNKCGYVRQGLDGSLLSLGPADQLRFIQAISCGKDDPEEFRQWVMEAIQRYDQTDKLARAKLGQLQEQQFDLENRLSNLSTDNIFRKVSDDKRNEILSRYKEYQESLVLRESLYNKSVELNDELHKDIYEKIDKLAFMQNSFNESSKARSTKLSELESKLSGLQAPKSKEEIEDLRKRLLCILDQRKYLDIKKSIDVLKSEVMETFPNLPYGEKAFSFILKDAVQITSEDIAKLDAIISEEVSELNELQKLKHPQYCPECNAPLAVINSSIVKTDDIPKNLQDVIYSKATSIQNHTNDRSKLNQELAALNKFLNTGMTLSQQLSKIKPMEDMPTIDMVDKEQSAIESIINANSGLVKEREALLSKIKDLNDSYVEEKTKIDALDRYVTNTPHRPKKKIVDEIKEIDNKIKTMPNLEYAKDEYEDLQQLDQRIEVALNTIANYSKDLSEVKEKVDVQKRECDLTSTYLAAIKRLKELSDESAVSAIQLTLEQINDRAQNLIDRLFPDDGTSVVLRNVSQTKKGDLKPKLSTEIFHKGKQAKKLSSLSGGERARVTLAFQLALAEIYRSPILLIDEGFSGLDEYNKSKCLEILKEVSQDRLIMVIEHGAPEAFFDEVIRV